LKIAENENIAFVDLYIFFLSLIFEWDEEALQQNLDITWMTFKEFAYYMLVEVQWWELNNAIDHVTIGYGYGFDDIWLRCFKD
jgi:hypothetical protein